MAKYAVIAREEGRDFGKTTHKFSTLTEVQEYVKGRWQGTEYMDGLHGFHSDYCTFELQGCTMADLGTRLGAPGTDAYWDWQWHDLGGK